MRDMDNKPASEAINQAERELNETQSLVEQQYGIIKRLKWLGAETKDAILLLINLLDLREGLWSQGEERTPIVSYATEEELAERGDPES